jgi:uncharacterized membrane protein
MVQTLKLDNSVKTYHPNSPAVRKSRRPTANFILACLLVVVGCSGITLRFYNLDRQSFWGDEVFTAFVVSGALRSDTESLFRNKIHSRDEYMKVQRVDPHKGTLDSLTELSRSFAEQTPLYYLCVREWAHAFGSSPAALRALSAIFGVLVLPVLFFLYRETSQDKMTAAIAVAMIAASPFFLFYSQQARPYSLWILLASVGNLFFIRCLRDNRTRDWLVYSLSMSLSLYTHFFTVFLFPVQAAFLLLQEVPRLTSRTSRFLLSVVAVVLTFLPWLRFMFEHRYKVEWMHVDKVSWGQLLQDEAAHFWHVFYSKISIDWLCMLEKGLILGVLILGITRLVKSATRRNFNLYHVFLIAIPAAGFFTIDGLLKEFISSIDRYQTIYLVAVPAIAAYGLADLLKSSRVWLKAVASATLITLLLVEMTSCYAYSQSIDWRNLTPGLDRAASFVNQSKEPLIVSDFGPALLILSHRLHSDAKLLTFHDADKPLIEITKSYSHFFLFGATAMKLLPQLSDFKITKCENNDYLWLAQRKN